MKRASRSLLAGLAPLMFFGIVAACSSTDGSGIADVPETGTDGRANDKPDVVQHDDPTDDASTDHKAPGDDDDDAGDGGDGGDPNDADAGDGGDPNDADAGDGGDPNDADAAPMCRQQDESCNKTDKLCCDGFECGGGGFVPHCVPVVAPACVKEGGDCNKDDLCCDGLTCNAAGKCELPAPMCRQLDETCNNADMLCCDGLECGGGGFITHCVPVAPACVKESGDCDKDRLCCDGLTCNAAGKCEVPAPMCRELDETCNNADKLCCDGLECGGGGFITHCVPVAPACVKEGGDCNKDDLCCDGLTCNAAGKCEVPAPACQQEHQICNKNDKLCCPGLECRGAGFALECLPPVAK